MYLKRLDHDFLERISSYIRDNEKASSYFDKLNEGHYDVYWSYDEGKHHLIYEAIPKKGEIGEYLYAEVDALRRVTTPDKKQEKSLALVAYIHEKEKDKDDETLKDFYSPYGEMLLFESTFTKEENDYRKKNSHLIIGLMSNLVSDLSKKETANEEASFRYSVTSSRYEPTYYAKVSLVREKGKEARIKDIEKLFRATQHEATVPLRTQEKEIHLTARSFSEGDKEAISILYRNYGKNYSYYDSGIALSESDFVEFLFALKGRKNFLYDQRLYEIEDAPKEGKASLKDDYSFSFSPPIEGKFHQGEGKGAMIPTRGDGPIVLVSFLDKTVQSLYDFAYKNPEFKYELFSREIGEDIAPLLEGSVKIADSVQEKHRARKPSIHYSVNYREEEGTLEFMTSYFLGEREVEKEEFLSLSLGQGKYSPFANELEKLSLPENGYFSTQEEIYAFLKKDLTTLNTLSEVYLSENLVGKSMRSIGGISFSVESGIDWFALHLESETLSEEELELIIKAYRKKRKFVRLKDGFFDLDDEGDESLKKLKDLNEDFAFNSKMKTKKLPLYQAFKLVNYEEEGLSYGEQIMNLLSAIKNYKERELPLKDSIKRVLRPYQYDGVKWLSVLSEFDLGGILADDMGLGKTLQTIALLSLYEGNDPHLIVCPKSLIYNWEAEFARWDASFKCHLIEGNKENRKRNFYQPSTGKDVYIISYESLRNDIDLLKDKAFSYVILDEGQNIANASSKKSQAVKLTKSRHRFVLTGTPIQNSLMDLWSIFDFLMPGYLPEQKSFYQDYVHNEEENSFKRASLAKKVQPFILRRRKEDVLKDLPPKSEEVITLSMNEEERNLYMAYFSRIRLALQRDEKGSRKEKADNKTYAIEILAELTRLRQLCVDPSMFLEDVDFVSSKISFALEYIKNALLNGHKVIVFSSFVTSLEHLSNHLKEENISYEMIIGKTAAATRITLANEFNNSDRIKVMLVSLKAGGTGLNLVGADIVIHLDPWWNYAAETQASDRAHRIGQERPVTIVKPIMKDSIEERVLTLQENKKDLASQFGGEDVSSISLKDLEYLLS